MPTGYTDKIKDGITFEQYALNCAKAFIPDYHDIDFSTPVSEVANQNDEDNYYEDKSKQEQDDLIKFINANNVDLVKQWEDDKQERLKYHKKSIDEKRNLRQKYVNMLEQVNMYKEPSEDHKAFKDFMRSQILDSIKFDCDEDYHLKIISQIKAETFHEWRQITIDSMIRSIEYYKKEAVKTKDNSEQKKKWISQLLESVKGK